MMMMCLANSVTRLFFNIGPLSGILKFAKVVTRFF